MPASDAPPRADRPPTRPPRPNLPPTRRVSAQSLLAGAQEVVIAHGGVEYRLRLTRAGKLILTK